MFSSKEQRTLKKRQIVDKLKYLFKKDPIRVPFLELPRPGLRHYRSNCPRFANSSLLKRSCTTLRLSYASIVKAFCSVSIKSLHKSLLPQNSNNWNIFFHPFHLFHPVLSLCYIKRENNLIFNFILEFNLVISHVKEGKDD